jgi:general stress protein 26
MPLQNSPELQEVIKRFLNTHRKAIFAILDKNGLPTTSLMLYAIDDDFNVYFGTRKSFSKYGEISKCPIVSLSVVEENIDPMKVTDIRGLVTEISRDELEATLTFFKSKNPAKYYVEGAEDFVMFKLTPNFLRWVDAESGELKITDFPIG